MISMFNFGDIGYDADTSPLNEIIIREKKRTTVSPIKKTSENLRKNIKKEIKDSQYTRKIKYKLS